MLDAALLAAMDWTDAAQVDRLVLSGLLGYHDEPAPEVIPILLDAVPRCLPREKSRERRENLYRVYFWLREQCGNDLPAGLFAPPTGSQDGEGASQDGLRRDVRLLWGWLAREQEEDLRDGLTDYLDELFTSWEHDGFYGIRLWIPGRAQKRFPPLDDPAWKQLDVFVEEACRGIRQGTGGTWGVRHGFTILARLDAWIGMAKRPELAERLAGHWEALWTAAAGRKPVGVPADAARRVKLVALGTAVDDRLLDRKTLTGRLTLADIDALDPGLSAEMRRDLLWWTWRNGDPALVPEMLEVIRSRYPKLGTHERVAFLARLKTPEPRGHFLAWMKDARGRVDDRLIDDLSRVGLYDIPRRPGKPAAWPEALPLLADALERVEAGADSYPDWYFKALLRVSHGDPARWRGRIREALREPKRFSHVDSRLLAGLMEPLARVGERFSAEAWRAALYKRSDVFTLPARLQAIREIGNNLDSLLKGRNAGDETTRWMKIPLQSAEERYAVACRLAAKPMTEEQLAAWRERMSGQTRSWRDAAALLLALRGEEDAVRIVLGEERGAFHWRKEPWLLAMALLVERNPDLIRRIHEKILLRAAARQGWAFGKASFAELERRAAEDRTGEWLNRLVDRHVDDTDHAGTLIRLLPHGDPAFRDWIGKIWGESWSELRDAALIHLRKGGRPVLDRLASCVRETSGETDTDDEDAPARGALHALHAIGTEEALDRLERLAGEVGEPTAGRIAGLIGRLDPVPGRAPAAACRWFNYRLERGRLGEVENALAGPHGTAAAAALYGRWPGIYRYGEAGAGRKRYVPEP